MKHNITLVVPTLLLAGCATNALRVESADEVSQLSRGLSIAAKIQLEAASQRRTQAYTSLIASDTSCQPNNPVYIYVRQNAGVKPASLCAPDSVTPIPGHDIVELDLGPIAAESLEPTYNLIGAIAAYGTALNKIVETPNADIAGDIATAIALAGRAEALAKGLGASGIPSVKALSDDQVKTASALLQFLSDLAR
jgi:hypothetical protein